MSDPITGKTLRWTYTDGPTKGTTFEHTFEADGTLTYRMVDGVKDGPSGAGKKAPIHYDVEKITDKVYAVSYLSPENGYTLTSILDEEKGTVVSFASNEQKLVVQHGTFDRA